MKAVRVHKPGGPEGLVYEDVPDPQAGAGQAVVKVEAIGLNFAEVNRRRGGRHRGGGRSRGHGIQSWGPCCL